MFSIFTIRDLFDFLIIYILIYYVLIWFRKASSRFLLIGLGFFAVLYIIALTFQLYLTALMLKSFFAIITITAPLLFKAPAPVNWLNYALAFAALAFAMASISVLIGVVSPNSRVTVLYSQIFFIPSILLAGMMFPYEMLPDTVGKIARLLPATQAMNAFKGLAMGAAADFDPWMSVIVLLVGGLMAFGLAIYLFSWDRRNSTRHGHPLLALLFLLPYGIGMFLG